MPDHDDDDVARALRSITPLRFFCGARRIGEAPIHPGEKSLYDGVDPKVRRATSTGRMLARELLRNLGITPAPILRGEGGAPIWPAGIAGSIAHDDEFAVCVVGTADSGADEEWATHANLIGVDVEPAHGLPAEILATVLVNADERATAGDDLVNARAIFCAKEAVYKMSYPLERKFYEFRDIALVRRRNAGGRYFPPSVMVAGPNRLHFHTSTGLEAWVTLVRTPRVIAVATWARELGRPPRGRRNSPTREAL